MIYVDYVCDGICRWHMQMTYADDICRWYRPAPGIASDPVKTFALTSGSALSILLIYICHSAYDYIIIMNILL